MIEIGQGFILHPENVQAGFVPLQDFLDRESSEAPVRVIRGPGLHAIVAVLGVIAADKVLQIGIGHRVLLECKVNVGSEIIYPDLLRLHLRAGWTLVEEQHIRLDARLIEYARGQPQNGVKIRGFQQLFADGFTGSAFKQHIVWHNHRRFARRVQNGVDMLDEVQLFVG